MPAAPLSDSCPAEQLAAYKQKEPGPLHVVAYVNCSAAVKALSDVICTSGNAVRIVEQVPQDREILFVPDQNLGQWVIGQTGTKDATLARQLLRPCFIHQGVYRDGAALEYPHAPVVAHPECIDSVQGNG